jgi:hypothetical protein
MNELLHHLIQALREELTQYGEMLALLEERQHRTRNGQGTDLLESTQAIIMQGQMMHAAASESHQRFRHLARTLHLEENIGPRELIRRLPRDYQPLIGALVHENRDLLVRIRKQAQHNHSVFTHRAAVLQHFIKTFIFSHPIAHLKPHSPSLQINPARPLAD